MAAEVKEAGQGGCRLPLRPLPRPAAFNLRRPCLRMEQRTQKGSSPLAGKTVRWTFEDGPTAGTAYEHSFGADGSVAFRPAGKGGWTKVQKHAVVQAGEGVWAVSYLSPESGFTLTAILDLRQGTVVGFASDGRQWFQQSGRFEILA